MIKAERYDYVGTSPAWPLMLKAIAELVEKGHAPSPRESPNWDDPAIVAIGDDGAAIGFMTYRHYPSRGSLFILVSWVSPDFRRNGIHTALFRSLVRHAIYMGVIMSIESGTHIDNEAARAAFEKQGRMPEHIFYRYDIDTTFSHGKPII